LTDSLLSIYRTAKRVANDKRYGTAGRERRVTELEVELLALCSVHSVEGSQTEGVEESLCMKRAQGRVRVRRSASAVNLMTSGVGRRRLEIMIARRADTARF